MNHIRCHRLVDLQGRDGVSRETRHIHMNGSRRARCGLSEGLPDQMRHLLNDFHLSAELGHWPEQRRVLNLLVCIFILHLSHMATREGNDTGMT